MVIFSYNYRLVVLSSYEMIKEAGRRDDMNGRLVPPHVARMRGSKDPWDNRQVPGLAVGCGENWKHLNALTMSIFKSLEVGQTPTEEQTLLDMNWLLSVLKAKNGMPVDIKNHLNLISVKTIWNICTGEELKPDDPKFIKLLSLLLTYYKEKGKLVYKILSLHPLIADLVIWLKLWDGGEQCQTSLYNAMQNTVSYVITGGDKFSPNGSRDCFISKYVEKTSRNDTDASFGRFNHANLTSLLMDLFLAGGDTTSITLCWALLFMALNPKIQEKIHRELDDTVGKRTISLASNRHCTPYTEAVLHEVQRLGNVADKAVPHRSTRDCLLSSGHFVPKDTMIVLWLGSVMKNPKLFPNPESFDPSRFLDETGTFSPDPNILAFSTGKRLCPGKGLALTQLYMVFSGIMSHFKIEKSHENDYISTIPMDGPALSPMALKLRFIPR